MNLLQFSHLELCLVGITAILFLMLLLYCLVLYRLPLKKYAEQNQTIKQDPDLLPPVSVIVYTQDKAENIRKHIPVFLEQNYPKFEVIVVGDDISEACIQELNVLKKQYPLLYCTYIPQEARYISKKKLALTLGIKAARYEKVLFAESDCEPFSENWLKSMALSYKGKEQMVIGFCSYPYHAGWKNQFIAFDNLKYGLQYLSAGLLKQFYNGTGKNLSYTKELFFANKGFYNQLYLKVGEDSLFINSVASSKNACVCYSVDSLMKRDEIFHLKQWTQERASRIVNQNLYRNKFYLIFDIECVIYWLFLGMTITLMATGLIGNYLLVIVSVMLLFIYYGLKCYLFYHSAQILQQRISLSRFIILDLFDNIYSAYIEFVSRFSKKKNYVFIIDNCVYRKNNEKRK